MDIPMFIALRDRSFRLNLEFVEKLSKEKPNKVSKHIDYKMKTNYEHV